MQDPLTLPVSGPYETERCAVVAGLITRAAS